MPRAAKQATLSRQWELLRLLPKVGSGKSTSELRQMLSEIGFEVTKRTVERDLLDLQEIFPLDCNDAGQPFGWRWLPDSHVSLQGMELSEALSLGLLEDLLKQLLPPTFVETLKGRFAEAANKLAALPDNRHARWADLVRYFPPGIPFVTRPVPERIFRSIQRGLLEQRQLAVAYTKADADQPADRTLHPLALVQQGVRGYLIATTDKHPEPRPYLIHRFSEIEVLDEPSQRPENFTLDQFIADGGMQFGGGKRITLRATICEPLATVLHETPLGDDQKITRHGDTHHLSVTVIDSWQLHFWILSQSPAITVTSPETLRRSIIDKLHASLTNYQPVSSPNDRSVKSV